MSRWNHPMCAPCWDQHNPDRQPVRVTTRPIEMCCWCGALTRHGIYVRVDPNSPDLQYCDHANDD